MKNRWILAIFSNNKDFLLFIFVPNPFRVFVSTYESFNFCIKIAKVGFCLFPPAVQSRSTVDPQKSLKMPWAWSKKLPGLVSTLATEKHPSGTQPKNFLWTYRVTTKVWDKQIRSLLTCSWSHKKVLAICVICRFWGFQNTKKHLCTIKNTALAAS